MKSAAQGTKATKENAPLAGRANVDQLNEIREKYKGETAATHAQRLLAAMRLFPVSTFEARKYLDIPHPAGRIQELRESGWDISTVRNSEKGFYGGRPHRIAVYVLHGRLKGNSEPLTASFT